MFQHLKSWSGAGGRADGSWPRLKAAIEFHETFGDYVSSGELDHPHEFEDMWPEGTGEISTHFENPAQHQAWRNIMIAGLEAMSGQSSRKSIALEAGRDDWLRLRDRCKELEFGSTHENNLLALRRICHCQPLRCSWFRQDQAETNPDF